MFGAAPDDDLVRLQRISELVDQGVNLAGIAHILDVESKNSQLQSDYTQLELLNAKRKAAREPVAARRKARRNEGRGSDDEGLRAHRATRRSK